ncbi:MAG TPA: hypothetical protein ENH13_01835 [Euryarchaeota archaeon]|nr:hypothetical protein BMS3Abin16_00773 [archaeon BMS3Abin16]GBE56788.1 hypothetical protein BMS3Bbin16_00999 [archaeon BMS3Bbin16]HDH27855.1 hypothetical protein [Euryarchaeota archaeon]
MNLVSAFERGHNVEEALDAAVEKINDQLKAVDGLIEKIDFQVDVGYSGATVSVTLSLNGDAPLHSEVLGVNRRGINNSQALKKATQNINERLEQRKGTIQDFAVKNIEPIPGRAYSTILVAINEDIIEDPQDAVSRRRRIQKALDLLSREPSTLNIAKVAEVFSVSRKMIYHDLEKLGFVRREGNVKKEEHKKQ